MSKIIFDGVSATQLTSRAINAMRSFMTVDLREHLEPKLLPGSYMLYFPVMERGIGVQSGSVSITATLVIAMLDDTYSIDWRIVIRKAPNNTGADIATITRLALSSFGRVGAGWDAATFDDLLVNSWFKLKNPKGTLPSPSSPDITLAEELVRLINTRINSEKDAADFFNQRAEMLDLPYIDELALDSQFQDVIDEVQAELDALFSSISNQTTSRSASAPVSSSSGTPVEQCTKRDLIVRMLGGEGLFTYTGHGQGYVIQIVYDYATHKYRAKTNDGVNGEGWTSFPNTMRQADALYFVPKGFLTFNGKNYRVTNPSQLILLNLPTF